MSSYEIESTAKIISKNKIKLSVKDKDFVLNSNNKLLDEFLKLDNGVIEKGWFDFFSLNIRYIDNKLLIKNLPEDNVSKKFYKILLETRSLCIGQTKFKGCKLNIEKVLYKIKKKIFENSRYNEECFFDFFFLKFQLRKIDNLKLTKKFPKIKNEQIELLLNNFDNAKEFYKIAKKISILFKQNEMQNNNQNEVSKNKKKR